MKALCWYGKGDIRCDSVDDPTIVDGRDVIGTQGNGADQHSESAGTT